MRRFPSVAGSSDRVWLHYGLTLVAYPFFRDAAAAIGQVARFGDPVLTGVIKQRLAATRGEMGSIDKATERVVFSLRDWGLLVDADRRSTYRPVEPRLSVEDRDVESWLLACVLHAHPAEEIPFADLIRLPETFPFRLAVGLDDIRRSPHLAVQRQGSGWDMVRAIR